MVNFEENYNFQGSRGGSNIFKGGGSNFFQGVQLLIPYRNPYNLFYFFSYILVDYDSVSKQWRQATPRADPEGG